MRKQEVSERWRHNSSAGWEVYSWRPEESTEEEVSSKGYGSASPER